MVKGGLTMVNEGSNYGERDHIDMTWHALTANGKQSAHVCATKHNAGHVACARIAAIAIKFL